MRKDIEKNENGVFGDDFWEQFIQKNLYLSHFLINGKYFWERRKNRNSFLGNLAMKMGMFLGKQKCFWEDKAVFGKAKAFLGRQSCFWESKSVFGKTKILLGNAGETWRFSKKKGLRQRW